MKFTLSKTPVQYIVYTTSRIWRRGGVPRDLTCRYTMTAQDSRVPASARAAQHKIPLPIYSILTRALITANPNVAFSLREEPKRPSIAIAMAFTCSVKNNEHNEAVAQAQASKSDMTSKNLPLKSQSFPPEHRSTHPTRLYFRVAQPTSAKMGSCT